MITVINAGGAGTRLWPLSTSKNPKYLLKLVENESLLQAAYQRAKRLSDTVYVITNAESLHLVREQLPELSEEFFVAEPDRRDTAGCFVVALNHVRQHHPSDEPVALLHADHFIRDIDGFVHSFKVAEAASREKGSIVLVGVEPDQPATGLGYIQKGKALNEQALVYNVQSFKEKPDFATAQSYVQSGRYLWNAGYFIGSVDTFLQAMEQFAPELKANYDRLAAATDSQSYQEVFLSFEKISIDYALIEKTKNLLVVPASFDWIDIGSFAEAHSVSPIDERGNFTKGPVETEEVTNSYIRNETDKPLAVIGLDNVAVINTEHGLLVMRKDMSQSVKKVVQRIQDKG
ncbi:MAG TPA: sugar phosphate nucleotidyltransferase [Candidatus Acidoferrum sp.]|nr:sugar phosphate nucleotidyltransferase [Candidatus Acidoferrum sp.]